MQPRSSVTVAVWIATFICVAVGGVIATLFGLMATSMDVSDVITQGTEPWSNALIAAAAFAGLVLVALLGLALWHTARFKAIGLVLVLIEGAAVIWASALVYREYF